MGVKSGDYVLATKFSDGDPNDHWCVGFYDKPFHNRHLVIDASGKQFRIGGFRRVKKISKNRGKFILSHREHIKQCQSLWCLAGYIDYKIQKLSRWAAVFGDWIDRPASRQIRSKHGPNRRTKTERAGTPLQRHTGF